MPTNAQWIPVEDAFELQLVDRLVREGRCFTKGLRYNLSGSRAVASATLLDAAGGPCEIVVRRARDAGAESVPLDEYKVIAGQAPWVWSVCDQVMPALPPANSGWKRSAASAAVSLADSSWST